MSATFGLQVPGESAVAITISNDAIASLQSMILSLTANGPSPTTLAGNVLITDTTFTLTTATGVTTGMAAVIANDYSLITAVAGNIITVQRSSFSSTKTAHTAGDPVTFLQSGSYSVALATLLTQQIKLLITQYPGPTVTTANTAIATQLALITSTTAAGATHAP